MDKLEAIVRGAVVFTSLYQVGTVNDPVVTAFGTITAVTTPVGGSLRPVASYFGIFTGIYSAAMANLVSGEYKPLNVAVGVLLAAGSALAMNYKPLKKHLIRE